MKSGLKDRNNQLVDVAVVQVSQTVSMKSGLKDRNNPRIAFLGSKG